MRKLLKRLAIAIGVGVASTLFADDELSPMQKHQKIDVVAYDSNSGRVLLSMVEVRPWGNKGELLPDLQEKMNTYLEYFICGQLARDYPKMKDKKLTLLLQTKYPITKREEDFIAIVKRRVLVPRDIQCVVSLMPDK